MNPQISCGQEWNCSGPGQQAGDCCGINKQDGQAEELYPLHIYRGYRTDNNETNTGMWDVEYGEEPGRRVAIANVVNFWPVNMELSTKNLMRTFSPHKLTDSSIHKNPKITTCKLPFTFYSGWRRVTWRYWTHTNVCCCYYYAGVTSSSNNQPTKKKRAITVCFTL